MSRILIVEDDLMIADNLELVLVDGGHTVCGIARNLAEAMWIGQTHRPDLAIVDLRLAHGELGTDVVAALRKLGPIAVLYATGNPEHPLLEHVYDVGCISKPYTTEGMLAAIEIVGNRLAWPARPPATLKGFRLLTRPCAAAAHS